MPKKSKLKVSEESSVESPEINNKAVDSEEIFNSVGELVVDVFETESEFVVLSAIAGIQIKDLDIAVDKDMMVISGQRQDPHLDIDKKYIRQECYWGPFSKKIVLPENIDVQKADAQMSKGVLVVKIPKMTNMEEADVELS